MQVGILGSGDVGKALAVGFVKHGHEVMVGTREPSKLTEWQKHEGPAVRIGSFEQAAVFGGIVVLATKGTAAKAALSLAGAKNLNGKTVIDATNPIADAPPENGVLKFFTTTDNSLMEQLQAAFPNARFVKAFNSIGSAFMVNPDFRGGKPTMFICGDHASAKTEVTAILDQFGFETEDVGGASAARALEPLCILWCLPGFLRNDWAHAFKLLKK